MVTSVAKRALEAEKQILYKIALELCRSSHHHQSSSQMLEMGLIMMCGEGPVSCAVLSSVR